MSLTQKTRRNTGRRMKTKLSLFSLLGIILILLFASCKVNELTSTTKLTTVLTSTINQTNTVTITMATTTTIPITATVIPTSTPTISSTLVPVTTKPRTTPVLYELAPDFELYDLEGNIVTLSQFRGSPIMLTFWMSG